MLQFIFVLSSFISGLFLGIFFRSAVRKYRYQISEKKKIKDSPTSWLLEELSQRDDIDK